jgi:D-3-phosphoglycerate dehydrogenase
MSPQVLIVGAIEFATDFCEELQKKYSIEYYTSKNRDEFIHDCANKYKEGITAIYLTHDSTRTIGVFNKEMISILPSSIKFICGHGAGYDNIDVNACADRDIMVSHTPGAVDNATADIAALLILSCCRNAIAASDNLKLGRWNKGVRMGIDPEGKVLGIIGAGGIGRTLAKRMSGFDLAKVQYYNRNRLSEESK